MNKKKLVIIILVFALLVISAVLLTIKLFNLENDTVETISNNAIENAISNNTIKNEVSNNVVNNSVQNNINTTQNATNKTTTTNKQEETKEDSQKNEEKAIDIVKNIWKNEQNVNISFEEIDNSGNYVVRVTKETKVLCWYTIDIETEKYTVKQNI